MDDETGEHREALGSLDQARGGEQVGHVDGGGHEGLCGSRDTELCAADTRSWCSGLWRMGRDKEGPGPTLSQADNNNTPHQRPESRTRHCVCHVSRLLIPVPGPHYLDELISQNTTSKHRAFENTET